MSKLLKNYIKQIITEISAEKRKQGISAPIPNPYKVKNHRTGAFDYFNHYGRIGKKWFHQNADQQWLNGPVENIIAVHSPIAYAVKEYASYEDCKRDMLIQYPCNTIIRNEQSAIGFVNRKADTISTEQYLQSVLQTFNFKHFNNGLFLHLSPRRITHAASVDSETNTYKHFPILKPISLKDWNNITIQQFIDRYENHINPEDFRFLQRNANKPKTDERAQSILNDMKNKYKYLRIYSGNPTYNYFISRQSSGARKWPAHYSNYEISSSEYIERQDILDMEDLNSSQIEVTNALEDEKAYEMGNSNYLDVLEDILGEIIVGNFKIHAIWVNTNSINMSKFNKWMNGEYSDDYIITDYRNKTQKHAIKSMYIKHSKLQEFYRLKYFVECGIPVYYFQAATNEKYLD